MGENVKKGDACDYDEEINESPNRDSYPLLL
jgi:hypothetical protein